MDGRAGGEMRGWLGFEYTRDGMGEEKKRKEWKREGRRYGGLKGCMCNASTREGWHGLRMVWMGCMKGPGVWDRESIACLM